MDSDLEEGSNAGGDKVSGSTASPVRTILFYVHGSEFCNLLDQRKTKGLGGNWGDVMDDGFHHA